jgi:hypothetical protein
VRAREGLASAEKVMARAQAQLQETRARFKALEGRVADAQARVKATSEQMAAHDELLTLQLNEAKAALIKAQANPQHRFAADHGEAAAKTRASQALRRARAILDERKGAEKAETAKLKARVVADEALLETQRQLIDKMQAIIKRQMRPRS